MQQKENYNYIQAFKWIYSRLLKKRKIQFWILFVGMSSAALLETVAVGSVAFFASVITDPQVMFNSKYVAFVQENTHLEILQTVNGLILASGFIMLGLILFKNGMKAFVVYGITRFGVLIEAYFGQVLLDGLLRLPYKWHLMRNSADLVTTIMWRTYLGREFFRPCLLILNNILMVAIMLTALFVIHPLVSISVTVVLGATSVFIYKVIKIQVEKTATIARDYQLVINQVTTMAIHGIKDVKISATENQFSSRFYKKAFPLARITGMQELYAESPVLILETIGFAMICAAIFFMLLMSNSSTAYVTGTMVVLAVTGWKALPAINKILNSITKVRKALPFIANEIMYFEEIEANEPPAGLKTSKSPVFEHQIHFNQVCFSYQDSDRHVIHDMSFEINKGDTVGIIGKSGAGKSTLVDLLIGLLKPVKGQISIDGTPLARELLTAWLQITGYVPQSPYIYDGSIAQNVAFGVDESDIDRQWVKQCCTMASMDEFMDDLPDGIDAFIGERGIRLSGGQQQRVAIARALYTRPEVMIFDEATSSLDTKSEKAIQETIYSFRGKQTLIIIAHRLSTVKACDYLIWIDNGTIRLQGKSDKVLSAYEKETVAT
jgi:ABC-type multidrug transport system fused ATPase/permease subunit